MAATEAEWPSSRPEHQVTGRDYPGEWARKIELYLDEEQRRFKLFAGVFGAFVLCIVVVLLIAVL
jgi:hypothetical protein